VLDSFFPANGLQFNDSGLILDEREIAEALTERCGHKTFQISWFWAYDGQPAPYPPLARSGVKEGLPTILPEPERFSEA
jgi:hypothetical protein